jgi:hypothetical protein
VNIQSENAPAKHWTSQAFVIPAQAGIQENQGTEFPPVRE